MTLCAATSRIPEFCENRNSATLESSHEEDRSLIKEVQPAALASLRIFVSYPRGGAAHTWADKLHAELRARGAIVWHDEYSIQPGASNWLASIEDGLRRAHVVVCVIGQESGGCRWQEREMLRADQLGLPLLACRVADVEMPLYAIERQPIELREPVDWQSVVHALLAFKLRPTSVEPTQSPPDPARRKRELAYLNAFVSGDLSAHEERYEPVAGEVRRGPTLERSHKGLRTGLRIDVTSVLEAFGYRDVPQVDDAPVRHADVLDAYRALSTRPIRRLVVLGEPGAGKSFSLQRIAVDHARLAIDDGAAPLPVLVQLGLWTRAAEPLGALIERQLGDALGPDFETLLAEHRVVLMLDGLNEIPPGQRHDKAAELRLMAEDDRFAAVLVSCRERDFREEFNLPFDRVTLQPLRPAQVLRFLRRVYRLDRGDDEGEREAERRFWALAGGEEVRNVWLKWRNAGASWDQFWSEGWAESEDAWQFKFKMSMVLDETWNGMRKRSLLRLASNPYLLTVIALLPGPARNRAELFDGFLKVLHLREMNAREARHDGASVPSEASWQAALVELAEALQRARPVDDRDEGAGTSLPRGRWPASMTSAMLAFSIDASVLQRSGDELRFTHQLLQEALAARALRRACETGDRPATDFWAGTTWQRRTGWEVVAEIAAESCVGDTVTLFTLLSWLADAQPEVAFQAWKRVGAPAFSEGLAESISSRLSARLVEETLEPDPVSRAVIGRTLAAFGLDRRPGVGLRSDGVPDIAWVQISDGSFVYQGKKHRALLPYEIARYPVTNGQFKAFVDAGGYTDARWWHALAMSKTRPQASAWSDSNAPRETVSWFEAMAFCNWLSHALGCVVSLPTERQWERAAAGDDGRKYPWGNGFDSRWANSGHYPQVGRTTAVGIYPHTSAEGLHDLSGNVWEWCLDEPTKPSRDHTNGDTSRVIRGGSWGNGLWNLRGATRDGRGPNFSDRHIGFRVCRC
ncbi:SUMF1/EgtB/PvdO family nonheme iron enzyme [Aquincola sp. S2]|uniref:SUMF1/EgtB/PvdO family nonheme iron enzyme n=1 Tax=Pseudaquabacterium terrae TaxID=2732868 RepID=A0ABX2EU99_9BURK|nr:SUMF1/EgtB/PvdO family nonheme iron enzyme [Aquabacterium terrae]NRF72222.1 SUMF1/EgtB/PvdO family nonheme iron enzyme [Aquabacterium terrae]